MSHTTKIAVEFKDKDSLDKAVLALGGSILGLGVHRLFSGSVSGYGFRLPGWQYPLIWDADKNNLSYDNYNGAWGDSRVLDNLKGEYALCVAESVAAAQGWVAQRSDNEVLIYHPDGGTIRVTAKGVDASLFTGANCVAACEPIEAALGGSQERMLKNEYFERPQEIIVKE